MTSTTDTLLNGLLDWVRIETHTPDTAGLNSLMDLVAAQAAAFGATSERIPGRDGTIEADLPIRIEGDEAYGPGICDMKGGAYNALAALRAVAESGITPPLPVRILYTSDEEVGSPTSRALIEEQGKWAKYALGRSAVTELAHQIIALEAMTDYDREITVNVGQITGGTGTNVVPQHASAEIDLRVPTAEAAEEMVAKIKGLTPKTPDTKLTITGGMNRPPFEQSAASKALFDHAAKLAEEIGFELIGETTGGGSDGNFIASHVATLTASARTATTCTR
eukprot:jgi/Tetstr1/465991/TSEL_010582.t1